MKLLLTLVVSVLAALGARLAVGAGAGREPAPAPDGARLDEVRAGIVELRRENERLAREIERRAGELVGSSAPAAEIGAAEIAAALERWRASHPAQPRVAGQQAGKAHAGTVLGSLDLATVPMLELVKGLSSEGLTHVEQQEIFQKLREAGRIDEYVAAIEALAAADPDDADLQVALGHAYLQKLFDVGMADAGPWAIKSDAAFDRALELDDHNWSARFSKAVSLSNWPAFMGRGPEAIEQFETLLEQQEALPKRNEFALTYLFLGNMHQAAGARDEAIAAWKKGLELFPNMEELRRALELASSPPGAHDVRR